MVPQHAAAVRQFVEHLNILRRESGNPSLGRLVELSEHKLLKNTLDDHLSGRRVRLPTWELVAAYVVACHRAAASTGLEVQALGGLRDWHNRYKAALEGNAQASCPVNVQHREMTGDTAKKKSTGDNKITSFLEYVADVLYCTYCDSDIGVGARFCPNCGGRVQESNISQFGVDDQMNASSLPTVSSDQYREAKQSVQSLPVRSAIIFVDSGYGFGRQSIVVDKNITTIGREAASDIMIEDDSVSWRHSVIYRHGTRFSIKDVGSLNGTFVNRKSIDKEEELESGDMIHIGAARLMFFQGVPHGS